MVGNKGRMEDLVLADGPLEVDEELHNLLIAYFLDNLDNPEQFAFTFSNGDLSLNPVYRFVSGVFESPDTFHENAANIAQHLYEVSQHPNIKAGDLYVAHFSGIAFENRIVEGLGIFKSETKDTYLKLTRKSRTFNLNADKGTNIRRLDKGCLVLRTDEEAGFKILIVDHLNAGEAMFWREDFLKVKPWSDAFYHTRNFLDLTHQYLAEEMEEEFKVTKADKIDLLNRSVDYFKRNEQFDQRAFETEVLADANVIESFRKFGENYKESHDLDIVDNFEISANAVKRQARIFKSVLKLDKNFHVYIHGNRELIERGYDEIMGKHFYKLYFDRED